MPLLFCQTDFGEEENRLENIIRWSNSKLVLKIRHNGILWVSKEQRQIPCIFKIAVRKIIVESHTSKSLEIILKQISVVTFGRGPAKVK